MTVAELMTAEVSTVAPEDTLADAVQKMWERDCGVVPVVDREGVPIAMLTDRDVCMATWSRALPPDRIRVADAMSPRVVVCRKSDAVDVAQSAMRMAQVRRLPVVDDAQRLVGLISLADLARAHESADHQHRDRSASGIAATLAAVCSKPAASRSVSTEEKTRGPAAA